MSEETNDQMVGSKPNLSTEEEARQVVEEAREKDWRSPSFLKELFFGDFRLDLIHPFPLVSAEGRPEFAQWYARFEDYLRQNVDPDAIDQAGHYPPELIKGLAELGAFGMKIPKQYGGLELNQVEYNHVMELLGAVDPSLMALLSAHQSIGVPQPVKLFGSEQLKNKYLPRCARGAISAFALSESGVGSDPSSLATVFEISADGSEYVINGEKLWTTNGTLAELMVVMARDPKTKRISAFVVEAVTPGVKVEHHCAFMGLKALSSTVHSFTDVRVPKENLIGKEGAGLKYALITLNTGRLSIPAGAVGTAKRCLEICRKWSSERVQWGVPIGKHEAIAHKLASMAATTFAMESVCDLVSQMADRGGYDIRLEGAAAKEWNSVNGWQLLDDTMQIRGGRGYETASSLAARGERAIGVERMMRDARINRIFGGSSETMHLFMAREAFDKHLKVAGPIIDKNRSLGQKVGALPGIAWFYARWYVSRWCRWGRWPRYSEWGSLAKHLRFIDRTTGRLSRQAFYGMMVHQGRLERKQGFIFRIVDIGTELFAMAASISRAHELAEAGTADSERALRLADLFCKRSRRHINKLFSDLWRNDDKAQYQLGQEVLKGQDAWLEREDITLQRAESPKSNEAEGPTAVAPQATAAPE